MPIFDEDPIDNLHGTGILTRLEPNFNMVGAKSATTYVMVLSVKSRNNEQLQQTLDFGNMFRPSFWLQKFTVVSTEGTKLP